MITSLWRFFMNIEQRVFAIAAEPLGVDPISVAPTSNLYTDLDMDSLDFVEFVMELEDEFNIEIDDESCAKWQTVQDVLDTVKEIGPK